MEQQVTISKKRLEELEKSAAKVDKLEQQIQALMRTLYGRSSERRAFVDPNQLSLFEEETQPAPAPEKQEISYTRNKPQKKKPVRAELPAHLPRKEEIVEPDNIPEDAVKIGEEVTEVLEIEQPKIWVRRIVRPKYASKANSEKEGVSGVVVASLPELPLPRSIYGASVLTYIIVSKYVDHLPFYRQRQMFSRYGYQMAESTMGEALNKVCRLLLPLFEQLRLEVLKQHYLQADESTIKVQDSHKKGATHLGYFWAYHAPLIRAVVFDYLASRAKEGPNLFLQPFSGLLQTDGYSGYNDVAARTDVAMFACMAHARRKFIEAEKNDAQRSRQAVDMIRKLYKVESYCREENLTYEQRLGLRKQESKPIMDEFKQWLDENSGVGVPKSSIREAINYTLGLWPRLERYLKHGEVEIDNNLIENTIRPIALGRKNYLFAGSHDAAQNAAMIYSFMATCKLNNIDPAKWLVKVLSEINETKTSDLHKLLPFNFEG
ncbi:IS66 family transposase [Limnospira platensis]|uniref:IS66 family transposase n=1 Tax=Limnospira platensis TaxID=118562 RepID=UPI0016866031|nr:IS66 family transposase [Arthrospira platensis FACHB-835]